MLHSKNMDEYVGIVDAKAKVEDAEAVRDRRAENLRKQMGIAVEARSRYTSSHENYHATGVRSDKNMRPRWQPASGVRAWRQNGDGPSKMARSRSEASFLSNRPATAR